ncbi:MAG: RnfABCDGE type electron transport complex subunit A [Acutalibacteraceae bacterium]|nr:RnfABCDGE type electron transport complex subunit A [Acutalibacteraceae bacterium]
MDMFKDFVIIIMTSVLVNNYVLSRFLGICPFLGVSKKTNQAFGMGVAVIFVMMMATIVTWPIQKFVLETLKLEYLQTIVFILVIAALVQLVEMILKKVLPSLHASLGIYLPLITTNCAVLAVCKNSLTEDILIKADTPQFLYAIVYAFASGLGFLLAMVLFAGVRNRIAASKPPKSFEGTPITLISASIVSLAFFGFGGIAENLFK